MLTACFCFPQVAKKKTLHARLKRMKRSSNTHRQKYARLTQPHSEGGYYGDSDVTTHFTCVTGRPTWAGHLILLCLTSRQLHRGGCHLIQKRGVALSSRLLPPSPSCSATGPESFQRQRNASDKSQEAVQRGQEREGKTEGWWKGMEKE